MPDINLVTKEKPTAPVAKAKKPSVATKTVTKKASTQNQAEGFDVNFITQQGGAKKAGGSRLTRRLVSSGFIAAALVALAYGGFYAYNYYSNESISAITQKMNTVESSISEIEKDRAQLVAFQSTLAHVKMLLVNHSYWSSFFKELEAYTIPDVLYTNFTSSANNVVTMSAIAKDFKAVGQQLRAFQDAAVPVKGESKPFISEVNINSANAILSPSGDTVGVNFSVNLTINPEVLKKK